MRLKIRTKIILSFFAPIIPLTVIVVIVSGYILNNLYNEAQKLDSRIRELYSSDELKHGMVLASDIHSKEGKLLLAEGSIISNIQLIKIQTLYRMKLLEQKIYVLD